MTRSIKTAIAVPDEAPAGTVRYTGILDSIVAAIETGAVLPGERLPAQRELAQRFGVAVGTVTRAYAEATRRGLVSGTPGRGTFVLPRVAGAAPHAGPHPCIDFTINRPPAQGCSEELARTLSQIARRADLAHLLLHQPIAGRLEHRSAGATLIARVGLRVDPARVVICNGVQHGIAAVLGARSSPGDLVLTESVNYPGIRLLAKMLRLRLQGVAIDAQGLIPDALKAACQRERPKFLFCTPTLHNPTAAVADRARREQIAALAARHGMIVIEDDICGLMPASPLAPIASLIPERTYYVTGASKSLGAGVRLGYVAAPADAAEEVASAVQATTWMVSPLMATLVTTWITDGTIDRVLSWNRAEAKARQNLARDVLVGLEYDAHPAAFHLWLHLPEPWRQHEFVAQARKLGLLLPSSEAFAIGRAKDAHAVRVSLTGVADRATLATGLEKLARLIAEGPRFEPVLA